MKRLIFLISVILQPSGSALAEVWNDVSRLNPEEVQTIVEVKSELDVIETLQQLTPGSHVVISGTRHSQGGHIVYPNAIVLDMTKFNSIISVSPANKTLIVQSGATWEQVQQAANRHSLSVKVMQSSNIFSVGGSISANVHGRDPRYGPIVETVRSLKIALHSGEIVNASRSLFSDLFFATIGGYGLVGVILQAEIELTDNLQLIKTTTQTNYAEYPATLVSNLGRMALHYGRCSFIKDETFLRECYSTNFYESGSVPVVSTLIPEKNIRRNSIIFSASRNSSLGKRLRWKLQKELVEVPGEKDPIDRNNAMRPPVKFLRYEGLSDTDILQEYFVPVANFPTFFDKLRNELIRNDINLLSVTLRYLKKNEESMLSYSIDDMIAIVLYINIGLDEQSISKAELWTKNLVRLALDHKGSYYLTYQRFPTLAQFQSGFPNWEKFMEAKCKYDPDQIFVSMFYEQYLKAAYNKALQSAKVPATRALCR